MEEISGTHVTFFRTNPKETRISTILIRGATPNLLDDVERAIDDGVNVYKVYYSILYYYYYCIYYIIFLCVIRFSSLISKA